MGVVQDRIAAWGSKNVGSASLLKTLRYLYCVKKKSQKEIAGMFKCPPPAIRYWLKNFKLLDSMPDKRFLKKVRSLGYGSLDDFFTSPQNVRKTFKTLAEDTGFSYVTVSQWYNRFLRNRGG